MFTTIDRYIGKTVLQMIFLCLTVLMLLTALITFIDKSRYIGTGDIDFVFLMWYVVLLMPNMLVMMFPVSVLLGTVIGLGMLAKSSELVIVQNMGKSRIDIVHSAGKMVIPLVLLVCGRTLLIALAPRVVYHVQVGVLGFVRVIALSLSLALCPMARFISSHAMTLRALSLLVTPQLKLVSTMPQKALGIFLTLRFLTTKISVY